MYSMFTTVKRTHKGEAKLQNLNLLHDRVLFKWLPALVLTSVVFRRDNTFAAEEPTFYDEQEPEKKSKKQVAQESIEGDLEQATEDFEETSETEGRHSSRKKTKPKYLADYDISTVVMGASVDDVPLTYDHIQGRPDSESCYKAISEEMNTIEK